MLEVVAITVVERDGELAPEGLAPLELLHDVGQPDHAEVAREEAAMPLEQSRPIDRPSRAAAVVDAVEGHDHRGLAEKKGVQADPEHQPPERGLGVTPHVVCPRTRTSGSTARVMWS